MPFGNKVQKWWIKNIISIETKITVNGKWDHERNNIIPFENPCLDEDDRALGLEIINNKKLQDKINFCFVGALNSHKGVDKIIETFKEIQSDKIGDIHFVGDSVETVSYTHLTLPTTPYV